MLLFSKNLEDIAELQDRLSGPISTLLLGFLAVPLAKVSPRSGVYGSLLVSFGIFFVYSNMQRVNHSWVISGKIPILAGYFWNDLVLLLLALMLLTRIYSLRWLVSYLGKGR